MPQTEDKTKDIFQAQKSLHHLTSPEQMGMGAGDSTMAIPPHPR